VFVFPAQITWGLAVVEAMAAGKPVVVSSKCGVSEIIQTNMNGIVVEHAAPADMAKQVGLLINDPSLRQKLGENAREYVSSHLSWKKYAERMERLFEKAIEAYK
jgi:glycosyltransferase involved in cell wall biosynthesis